MDDSLEKNEQATLGLVGQLNPEGYALDPVNDKLVKSLTGDPNPSTQELGEYLQENKGFGHGAEYQGRLARVQEAVGVGKTSSELSTRQQFEWGAGEVIELDEFVPAVQTDEEVQITDYKGRQYHLVRTPEGFEIIGAYHANDKPIVGRRGQKMEGKTVTLRRFQTETDRIMAAHGMSSSYIRLAEVGTKTRQAKKGEEYTESRGGRQTKVSVARLFMDFGEDEGYGMLASKIKLIPKDIKEKERLQAAQWRIRDSIQVIQGIFEANRSDDPILHPEVELDVDGLRYTKIKILDKGETLSLTEETTQSDEPRMTEYSFSSKNGGSKKTYIKAGNNWVVPMMPGLERDGSVKLSISETAREIDKIRYSLRETK